MWHGYAPMNGMAGSSPAMTTPWQPNVLREFNPNVESLDDDLHVLAGLELVVGVEAIEDPEAVELAVDQCHA
jgi:hypothetical protein